VTEQLPWPDQPGPGYPPPQPPNDASRGGWPSELSRYQGSRGYAPTGYGPIGYGQMAGYKGARYGLPPAGPGALASQWRRWAARLLDGLIELPVVFIIMLPLIIDVAHQASNEAGTSTGTAQPTKGVLATEGLLFLGILLLLCGQVCWEALATRHWGRTPGKAILGIRPVRVQQGRANPGRMPAGTCWGRAAFYNLIGLVPCVGGIIALLNELWCLWDQDRQCLHDKAAHTLVINDL